MTLMGHRNRRRLTSSSCSPRAPFASSLCSSRALFPISNALCVFAFPTIQWRAPFEVRVTYSPFRMLFVKFVCHIFQSRTPFEVRVLYLYFACSLASSRALFSNRVHHLKSGCTIFRLSCSIFRSNALFCT